MSNARRVAVNALLRVDYENAYSNLVIDVELKKSDLDERDKALATALFYGALERRVTIDYYIEKNSNMKIKYITKLALECIRIGIYQILYMDKIPPSAAVNESVNIVKASDESRGAGFVNAVLRSVIRGGANIELPKDEIERMSIEFSCPVELVKHYMKDYGKAIALRIMASALEKAPITVRVNTTKISAEELMKSFEASGIIATKSDICEHSLLLSGTGSIEKLDEYQKGYFHIQDNSSQLCVKALAPTKKDRVLDVCSAPGGKAFTIAETMNDGGEVFALDLYPHKIGLIDSGAERLGLTSIKTFVNDAAVFNADFGKFSRVLCDLPCSGLGIIRKKPEISYNVVAFLDNLPKMQYSLLCTSSKYVENGGTLIYSTCTLSKKENEEVAEKFLKENVDFEPLVILPEIDRVYKQPTNMITFLPHFHQTDGFFISAFRKKG